MLDLAEANGYMDKVVSRLRDQLSDANGLWDSITRDSNVAAALEKDKGYVEQLDGELREKVLAGGAYTLEQWSGFAKDVSSDVALQNSVQERSTIKAFWAEVALPTLQTAGEDVNKFAGGAGVGFGVAIAVALVVLLLVRFG